MAASPLALSAQEVDRTKYPDYSDKLNPDYSLRTPRRVRSKVTGEVMTRPDHVNNAETRYFPPVFNQAGGSCGSASRICYMFSHEMNAFRGTDGKDPKNYYPSHFVWLLTNGNSGKNEFVEFVGVPSAATYGGQTYSSLFGYQDTADNDFGWMNGYNKWFEAMHNRMLTPKNFPDNVATEEGREAVKNYLWNHNGDTDFHTGGIVGIGVASGGDWRKIPKTATNDEIGVTGMSYVYRWGRQMDHALTVVGYDDRIEFDLNGNGKYGEESADEKGAWIVVNSWGAGWCNGGFIYCPYAHAGPAFLEGATKPVDYWYPEIYSVRKNYKPMRTIKVKMDYSRRSELLLSAGVSKNLNATEPEASLVFDHFKYAGDGNWGNTVPAPEIPMLGRWADGKLHSEPMEFGYDLTDLSAKFDQNEALKYFFIIDTKSTAEGNGRIHEASILDYSDDAEGLEMPFNTGSEGVEIQNQGNRTIISVVVGGRGVKAPQNVGINNGVLTWSAPEASSYTLTGYKVMKGQETLATTAANVTSFTLPSDEVTTYTVQAVYGSKLSTAVAATVSADMKTNVNLKLAESGMTIPGIFGTKYDQATIEYFIKPTSVKNWNQTVGPKWGQFMMHANANGALTVGWDINHRVEIPQALKVGSWSHIAVVVDNNEMTVYVNGTKKANFTSDTYSGLGGFGNLTFKESGRDCQDACYDEIRIWKTARTANEISSNRIRQFADACQPEGLIAYYKGDVLQMDGDAYLRDHTPAQNHAKIANSNYEVLTTGSQTMIYDSSLKLSVVDPEGEVVVGQPITLRATGSTGIQTLQWTIEDAGLNNITTITPTVVFNHAGEQKVHVVGTNTAGKTVEADATITVAEAPAPQADFTVSKQTIVAGERVTFMAGSMLSGNKYEWQLQGASLTQSNKSYVTVSYSQSGTYKATLTVTDLQGRKATTSQDVTVSMAAPLVEFDVTPAVVQKGEFVHLANKSLYDPEECVWTLSNETHIMRGEEADIFFKPTIPGIYNVTLAAKNSVGKNELTRNSGLIVCNADSKTGLRFTPQGASVECKQSPIRTGLRNFTVDWWMRPDRMSGNANGIGESKSSFLINTNASGQLELNLKNLTASSNEGAVIPNEWHHYAVSFSQGNVMFFRDGEVVGQTTINLTLVPSMKSFSLGTDAAPMNCIIDEFRTWNVSMTGKDLQDCITEPLEGTALDEAVNKGLQVYYRFDQNGGDVEDATPNANNGTRQGFGPDGDAWTESAGVFALNFDNGVKDVSSDYLTNYEAPFASTGNVFNTTNPNRFVELADWKTENIVEETTGHKTGAHVDKQKDNNFAITTKWDGFSDKLTNHKVYQTITLPAGAYKFTAYYGKYEGQADGTFLVAAPGNTLPDTENLADLALGYKNMDSKNSAAFNTVTFLVTEPTEVSLGILSNLTGQSCLSLSKFSLEMYEIIRIVHDPTGIEDILTPEEINTNNRNIYDLSGRKIRVPGKGVYIIGNKKVIK